MNYISESYMYKSTLIGGKELLVEGHKGVYAYSKEEIVLRVKGGKIVCKGEHLCIEEINEYEVKIMGKIISLEVV